MEGPRTVSKVTEGMIFVTFDTFRAVFGLSTQCVCVGRLYRKSCQTRQTRQNWCAASVSSSGWMVGFSPPLGGFGGFGQLFTKLPLDDFHFSRGEFTGKWVQWVQWVQLGTVGFGVKTN